MLGQSASHRDGHALAFKGALVERLLNTRSDRAVLALFVLRLLR